MHKSLPISPLRALALVAVMLTIPLYGDAMREGVLKGIRLSVYTVIPSVFPFMVLSSMIVGYGVFDRITVLSRPFERLFRVNKNGLCAFLCGILCGFPLGAKCASEAYTQGLLTKDECERLIGFSSNASPAFLILGVGAMQGSVSEGVFLYAVMLFSAVLVGILLGRKKTPHAAIGAVADPNGFSLTDAVERAGLGTLYICSYLLFFSALIGILQAYVLRAEALCAAVLPFLEIGSAVVFLSGTSLHPLLRRALIAFAVSFGGLCVHLQASGLLRGTGISMKRYYTAKLLQGLLSFLLVLLLGRFF